MYLLICWPISSSLLQFWFDKQAYAQKLVETAFANWENVEKSDNEISTIVSPPPRIGGMSSCHQGNLVTVDECQSLEFQNTSVSTMLSPKLFAY